MGFRIVGPPPPKGAPKVERLKFVRRCYSRILPFYIPAFILLALVHAPTWTWIGLVAGAVVGLEGFVSTSLRIRHQAKGPPTC